MWRRLPRVRPVRDRRLARRHLGHASTHMTPADPEPDPLSMAADWLVQATLGGRTRQSRSAGWRPFWNVTEPRSERRQPSCPGSGRAGIEADPAEGRPDRGPRGPRRRRPARGRSAPTPRCVRILPPSATGPLDTGRRVRERRARDRSRSEAMTPSSGFLLVRCGGPEAQRLGTLRLWQGYLVHPRELLVLWPISFRGRIVSQSVGQASPGQARGRKRRRTRCGTGTSRTAPTGNQASVGRS